jgi:tetratricopeptide (TPR) repeat protein
LTEEKRMPADLPDRDIKAQNGTLPTTFEDWCHLAGNYGLEEWWYEAADAYARALALRPTDAGTWAGFGDAVLKSRQTIQAAEAFVRALSLRGQGFTREPQDQSGPETATEGEERTEALQELATLELGLLLYPSDAKYWMWRGNLLAELGRREEALQDFDRALALGASDAFVFGAKGRVQMGLGRYEEALEVFRRAIAWSNFPEEWDGQGQVLMRLGRHAEATESFERATALAPNYGAAWLHLADALRALGRLANAQDVERRGRALPPDDTSMPF